jgi:hypothetical protein
MAYRIDSLDDTLEFAPTPKAAFERLEALGAKVPEKRHLERAIGRMAVGSEISVQADRPEGDTLFIERIG